jgi:hypothetical protein
MNIDERLDRLTKSHEALTQSVEMLLVSVRETSDSVKRLDKIAELHERRLDSLEQ